MRTPLHTILGYASLLKAGANDEDKERLDIIEESARQLLTLLNELQQSASLDTHEPHTSADPFMRRDWEAISALLAQLPEPETAIFRELLGLGRLLQIECWASSLIDRYPLHEASARQIMALARSANLPALANLFKPASAPENRG
ncbi:MAG: His Kinase (phospho-acceptor) domain [Pseudomonadota bacterium]